MRKQQSTIFFLAFILFFNFYSLTFSQGGDYGRSLDCNVNVNCPDFNDAYRNADKRSAVSIGGFCTGNLINQVNATDGTIRSLILTAEHCIDEGRDLSNTVFIFNYQSKDCDNNSVPINNRGLGPAPSEQSEDENSDGFRYYHTGGARVIYQSDALDVALLELNRPIPPQYHVYYAGWNAVPGIFSTIGVGIDISNGTPPYNAYHHPRGDIKKVSETSDLTFLLGETNTVCWWIAAFLDGFLRIFGAKTYLTRICVYTEIPRWSLPFWQNGITETGSSGSGLFSNGRKIVGVLSKGTKFPECFISSSELYGKLRSAYHTSSDFRKALNPDDDYDFIEEGKQISCYPVNTLGGHFWPARDYLPANGQQYDYNIGLQFPGDITFNRTTIVHPNSEFTLRAKSFETSGLVVNNAKTWILEPGSQCLNGNIVAPPSPTYPDPIWENTAFRQAYADSLCLTMTQMDSVLFFQFSPNIYRTVFNCPHFKQKVGGDSAISANKEMIADSLCLTLAELDTLLSGNLTPNIYHKIEDCPTGFLPPNPGNRMEDLSQTETNPTIPLTVYPAPFNDFLNFTVNLPSEGIVKLELFNALGQKVAEVHHQKLKKGIHVIDYDASSLSAGSYFCVLKYNGRPLLSKPLLKF